MTMFEAGNSSSWPSSESLSLEAVLPSDDFLAKSFARKEAFFLPERLNSCRQC